MVLYEWLKWTANKPAYLQIVGGGGGRTANRPNFCRQRAPSRCARGGLQIGLTFFFPTACAFSVCPCRALLPLCPLTFPLEVGNVVILAKLFVVGHHRSPVLIVIAKHEICRAETSQWSVGWKIKRIFYIRPIKDDLFKAVCTIFFFYIINLYVNIIGNCNKVQIFRFFIPSIFYALQ